MAIHLADKGLGGRDRTICFYDHTSDRGVDVFHPPAGSESLRSGYLFPEGPLVYGTPRPDSRTNTHCTSCHIDAPGRPAALASAALTPGAIGVSMQDDDRRQPFQPPPRLYGHIPANLYGPGLPESPIVSPPQGCPTDALVFGSNRVPDGWCPTSCSDGVDNNGDGQIDFPADAGCVSSSEGVETPLAAGVVDSDSDGVSDGSDECVGTGADVEVDPAGCSCQQLDELELFPIGEVIACPEPALALLQLLSLGVLYTMSRQRAFPYGCGPTVPGARESPEELYHGERGAAQR